MSDGENWAEWVRRVIGARAQAAVATQTGVAQTNIGRWLRGETDAPKAESVVAFARALGEEPLEALIAAGYLTPEEAGAQVCVKSGLGSFSTQHLLDELAGRVIRDGGGLDAERPTQQGDQS